MKIKTKSRNPYNEELSKKYNSDYKFDHPHQFMAYSTWLNEIGDVKGKKILDLACGSGISSRMLSDKGAEVVGVDISQPMLEVAKQRESADPAGNKYILADAAIPELYSRGQFDLVVAAFLLHYADSIDVLDGFMQNISLNLKPGGKFVSINISPDHPIVSPGKNISHSSVWLDKPFSDGSRLEVTLWDQQDKLICKLIDYYWSKATYEASLKRAGLDNIRWTEIKMHEDGKSLENWEKLEKQNMLVVIRATKP